MMIELAGNAMSARFSSEQAVIRVVGAAAGVRRRLVEQQGCCHHGHEKPTANASTRVVTKRSFNLMFVPLLISGLVHRLAEDETSRRRFGRWLDGCGFELNWRARS